MKYYITQEGRDFLGEAEEGRGGAPKLTGAKRHSPKAIKTRLVRGVTKRLGMGRKEFARGVAQGDLISRETHARGDDLA